MILASQRAIVMAMFAVLAGLSWPGSAKENRPPEPVLKSGLWEIQRSESNPVDHRTSERRCVGPRAKEIELVRKEYDLEKRTCKYSEVIRSTRRTTYSKQCTKDGLEIRHKIVYSGDFSRSFSKTQTVNFSVPIPLDGKVQTSDFNFVGPCPKGVTPGDSVIFNRDGVEISKRNRFNPPQPNKNPPVREK